MDKSGTINPVYEVPQPFYEKYIGPRRKRIQTKADLVTLWEDALTYRKQYPDLQESIAEWTMSTGASSPFVHDNNLYEAIHLEFGALEVNYPEDTHAEAGWQRLEKLVAEAKARDAH